MRRARRVPTPNDVTRDHIGLTAKYSVTESEPVGLPHKVERRKDSDRDGRETNVDCRVERRDR